MKKKKRLTAHIPPEYWANKKKWEKRRHASRYQRIWKIFKESHNYKASGYYPFGKCLVSPEKMFKTYGVHRPIDPAGNYPSYEDVCLQYPTLFEEVTPSFFLVSPNIRPTLGADGQFYDWSDGITYIDEKTGEEHFIEPTLVELRQLYEEYPREELKKELSELEIKVDLTRDKKTALADFAKLIERYYLLRKYFGFKNKRIRLKGVKIVKFPRGEKLSRKDKLIYATFLLTDILNLKLREIADLPKSPARIKSLIAAKKEWDKEKLEKVRTYFSNLAKPVKRKRGPGIQSDDEDDLETDF